MGDVIITSMMFRYILVNYRKISNISGTQNQNLNDSRLIMQMPFPNALKPGVKSRMKM